MSVWIRRIVAAGLVTAALSAAAAAGPPLICHELECGSSKVLAIPSGERNYIESKLQSDLIALLQSDTPLLARMESMRVATIAVSERPAIAMSILAELQGRALNANSNDRAHALALFDAGYLVECYRVYGLVDRDNTTLDGYGWAKRAQTMYDGGPEMEFGLALMTFDRDRSRFAEHLGRAVHGTNGDTLLATNITRQFHGSLEELRNRYRIK
ncbi:MAG: hypothetical protein ACF8PN_14635 [Phycisphaerales bacterium]